MFYYQITGNRAAPSNSPNETTHSPSDRKEYVSGLLARCENYNRRYPDQFTFIVNVDERHIIFDAICKEALDDHTVDWFVKSIGLSLCGVGREEILFGQMRNDLVMSFRNHYIADDDEIMTRFHLDEFNRSRINGMSFGENLVEKRKKADLVGECKELLAGESFIPEMDRIFKKGTAPYVEGHPVHYIILTDTLEARKNLTRLLLSALYSSGRVKSRRYSYVNADDDFSYAGYDLLCESMIGGSAVVRFEKNDESFLGDNATELLDNADSVCRLLRKYRNSVQTIICLPRGAERLKSVFYNLLGNVAVVELKEDLTNAANAAKYFKKRAKSKGIQADDELISSVNKDELYLPDQLNELFEEWFNRKLRTEIYPQYAEAKTGNKITQKEKPRGSAYEELTSMIGLSEAKAVINKVLDYHKFNKLYGGRIDSTELPAMHMVFTGSPGTAKTTVARLFARILKENGILSTGVMVEVGRSDLVGKYVGWTANIVKEKFKKASGGVLFIDEAYSLVDDRSGSYGDEAINTIVQEMENRREEVVVIFAGYTDKMEEFLNRNPGLRSRIAWHVPFPDYTAEELADIALLYAQKKGLTLSREAEEKLLSAFESARNSKDFGNGRYVRNLMEKAKMNLASRLVTADPETVTERMLTTIEAEDIETPPGKAVTSERRKIGFGA